MKLERLSYDPATVLDFYDEGLSHLGALSERTWHDRLEIVAEGPAATLWNREGKLHEVELKFGPADATTARDAAREVFPGSPLTFRLADALRPPALQLERLVLEGAGRGHPPDLSVAEKLWRAQFENTTRWRLAEPFKPGFHFSLLALARCEIRAIDQRWSLHRVAISLPSGRPDEHLARDFTFVQPDPEPPSDIVWPKLDPAHWTTLLRPALEQDLETELREVRLRQENSLRRELDRIDTYFQNYAHELNARSDRTSSEQVKIKTTERLAAAKAEHARRRADQVNRHEIHIEPHLDALLLIAEPAWETTLDVHQAHASKHLPATFIPRSRSWELH